MGVSKSQQARKSGYPAGKNFCAAGAAAVESEWAESADGNISQPLASEPAELARAEAAAAPSTMREL